MLIMSVELEPANTECQVTWEASAPGAMRALIENLYITVNYCGEIETYQL